MDLFRPIIKGWVGELKSKLSQRIFLDSNIYHFFDNIIIKDEFGSTQIDHIIVSKFGIFVIETKDMNGWIFGSEKGKNWTQTFYNKKIQFQNPLHQNYRHTKSLSKYLNVNHDKMIPVVIFWGDCKFKTRMPENVIHGGVTGSTKYIKGFTDIMFTDEEVIKICDMLKSGKSEMGIMSGFQHVKSLNKRHNSDTICPKCGGNLLERSGKRGVFLGCENFPMCRFTKELVD